MATEVCVGHVRNANGYDDIHAFINSEHKTNEFIGRLDPLRHYVI